jgi:hypothetical protein
MGSAESEKEESDDIKKRRRRTRKNPPTATTTVMMPARHEDSKHQLMLNDAEAGWILSVPLMMKSHW